ncbi:unnamed protein product [Symbiodinium natans]|uniref:Apple domain-containing protein n=1 Tax=Symbiodinium natans TaxID=878477 RepID=A0A812UHC3_9DINO|nr:unnamed protein product [Symbiodinium natans]
MALPSSDTELLEAPQGSHSTLGTPFPRRLAMVLGGISLVALALLSQRSPRGLRSKMSGFVGLADSCLEKGMFYANPHKMENTEKTVETTAESCQQRCVNTPACEHFTFWPDGGCLLTDASSTAKAAPYQYSDIVSGPASCEDSLSPSSETQTATDTFGKTVQTLVAAAPGVNGSSCSAYPACVAAGIKEGSCCPNDAKVSLGCCNGFPPKVAELKIAAGTACIDFPACARMNITGACCPASDGVRLSCCDKMTSV